MHLRVVGATALLSSALGFGPTPQAGVPSSGQEPLVFSAESELVVLQVRVEDRHGQYVRGLTREAFSVLEDGKPQTIAFFSGQDAPATVGLLLDSSGSMREVREYVIAAAATFVTSSNPEDEMFALTFGDRVQAVLPAGNPFTKDGTALRRALSDAIVSRGRTALLDAVAQGVRYSDAGTHQRKVLVVVSDGGDNASTVSFDAIVSISQRSNVLIYAVVPRDPANVDVNPKRLKQLAARTGGEAFEPRAARDVPPVLEHIARDVRHLYTLGYTPPPSAQPGLRHVDVRVRVPFGSVRVRTREGYVVERAR